MKINKSFVLPIITGLIGAGIASIYFQFSGNPTLDIAAARSERISLKDAVDYQRKFDKIKPLRVTHKGVYNSNAEKTEPLEGFVFNASDLYEIVRNNRSGETPDEVIFYFGQDGEAGPSTDRHGVIHIIAIGRKNNKLLIKDKDTVRNEPSIFDKADPCPPFCGTIKTE